MKTKILPFDELEKKIILDELGRDLSIKTNLSSKYTNLCKKVIQNKGTNLDLTQDELQMLRYCFDIKQRNYDFEYSKEYAMKLANIFNKINSVYKN